MTQISDDLLTPRFAALAYPFDDSDWGDVVRRAHVPAGKRRLPSRRRTLAVALLIAAAVVFLVAPALGIGPPALDFFAAKHAPKDVALDFERMNVGAPKGMSPGAIASQTRLVKTYHLHNGHPWPLMVAPTRKGTFCFTFGGGGGCSGRHVPTSHEQGDVDSGAIGLTIEGAFHSTVLAGYVYDKRIAELQVRFEHGSPVSVPLVWVSPPIDAGFFFYDVSHAQRTHDRVVAVAALDEHGKELARIASIFHPAFPWANPRNVADLARKHVILRSGPVSIAIAPSRTGGNCWWLQGTAGTVGGGCAPPRYLTTPMAGGLNHTTWTAFSAQLQPTVARVELRFQDGSRIELKPVEGFVLYTIPRAHWPREHRLTAAIAYSSAGRQLSGERFDPDETGTYPCKRPRPIGAGLTACP
jgi:hypothetical protein